MTAVENKREPSVCAVIVTYNPDEVLGQSLATVAPQVERVIIVDNDSSNVKLAEIKNIVSTYENIELILNDDNYGLGHAFNQGIEQALDESYDWVLTLDDDSVLSADAVKVMLEAYRRCPSRHEIGIIAPRCHYKDREDLNRTEEELRTTGNHEGALFFVKQLITSGNLIPRQVLEEAGLLEASYFIDYIDMEFCLRVRRKGYRLATVPNSTLIHSLGKVVRRLILGLYTLFCTMTESPERWYYRLRNRILTYRKYLLVFPGWIIYDLYRSSREIIKILIVGPRRHVLLGYVFKGIYDGIRGVDGPIS